MTSDRPDRVTGSPLRRIRRKLGRRVVRRPHVSTYEPHEYEWVVDGSEGLDAEPYMINRRTITADPSLQRSGSESRSTAFYEDASEFWEPQQAPTSLSPALSQGSFTHHRPPEHSHLLDSLHSPTPTASDAPPMHLLFPNTLQFSSSPGNSDVIHPIAMHLELDSGQKERKLNKMTAGHRQQREGKGQRRPIHAIDELLSPKRHVADTTESLITNPSDFFHVSETSQTTLVDTHGAFQPPIPSKHIDIHPSLRSPLTIPKKTVQSIDNGIPMLARPRSPLSLSALLQGVTDDGIGSPRQASPDAEFKRLHHSSDLDTSEYPSEWIETTSHPSALEAHPHRHQLELSLIPSISNHHRNANQQGIGYPALHLARCIANLSATRNSLMDGWNGMISSVLEMRLRSYLVTKTIHPWHEVCSKLQSSLLTAARMHIAHRTIHSLLRPAMSALTALKRKEEACRNRRACDILLELRDITEYRFALDAQARLQSRYIEHQPFDYLTSTGHCLALWLAWEASASQHEGPVLPHWLNEKISPMLPFMIIHKGCSPTDDFSRQGVFQSLARIRLRFHIRHLPLENTLASGLSALILHASINHALIEAAGKIVCEQNFDPRFASLLWSLSGHEPNSRTKKSTAPARIEVDRFVLDATAFKNIEGEVVSIIEEIYGSTSTGPSSFRKKFKEVLKVELVAIITHGIKVSQGLSSRRDSSTRETRSLVWEDLGKAPASIDFHTLMLSTPHHHDESTHANISWSSALGGLSLLPIPPRWNPSDCLKSRN